MSRHANTIPEVVDVGRRVARTAVSLALSFGTFALIYPAIVATIIGTLHLPTDSRITVALLASAAWVTGASLLITRIMAIPAVNTWLEKLHLAGHSTEVIAGDTPTTFNQVISPEAAAAYRDRH